MLQNWIQIITFIEYTVILVLLHHRTEAFIALLLSLSEGNLVIFQFTFILWFGFWAFEALLVLSSRLFIYLYCHYLPLCVRAMPMNSFDREILVCERGKQALMKWKCVFTAHTVWYSYICATETLHFGTDFHIYWSQQSRHTVYINHTVQFGL